MVRVNSDTYHNFNIEIEEYIKDNAVNSIATAIIEIGKKYGLDIDRIPQYLAPKYIGMLEEEYNLEIEDSII